MSRAKLSSPSPPAHPTQSPRPLGESAPLLARVHNILSHFTFIRTTVWLLVRVILQYTPRILASVRCAPASYRHPCFPVTHFLTVAKMLMPRPDTAPTELTLSAHLHALLFSAIIREAPVYHFDSISSLALRPESG